MRDPGVLVIVPTYNERENIGVLVPRPLAIDGLCVTIVDDVSPESTSDEADHLAAESGGRRILDCTSGFRCWPHDPLALSKLSGRVIRESIGIACRLAARR